VPEDLGHPLRANFEIGGEFGDSGGPTVLGLEMGAGLDDPA
jgi:hypothetical protein